jgi:hypothetical protein
VIEQPAAETLVNVSGMTQLCDVPWTNPTETLSCEDAQAESVGGAGDGADLGDTLGRNLDWVRPDEPANPRARATTPAPTSAETPTKNQRRR